MIFAYHRFVGTVLKHFSKWFAFCFAESGYERPLKVSVRFSVRQDHGETGAGALLYRWSVKRGAVGEFKRVSG